MVNKYENIPLSSPALLQKIDKLRELGIGHHLSLPQLVVVGDQSSGKSSLLESLTGIPFPRNVELCTRHATQITLRRDDQSRVEIRIIPGPRASEEHKKFIGTYIETMKSSKELRLRFLDVLKEANTKMGIRADLSLKTGNVFSEDILKIEISGPHEDYLTIVDVPGIFRNHTEGITTKKDIALVNMLVRKYIQNRRTIILAVLPSNVDIATQEILALAEEYDPVGERTLGVLTKPDLVNESNAQISVCNLVSGIRKPLSLGYYLVRNRGADHEDTVDQTALEAIFKQEPWSSLPSERVGTAALKKRLETLLEQIARRELPHLRKDAIEKLAECQRDLDDLGPSRPTSREQRVYLSSVARSFENLTKGALGAQYSHLRFFERPEMRLITRLVNLTCGFSDGFRLYGQLRHFKDIMAETPPPEPEEYYQGSNTNSSSRSSSPSHPDRFHTYLRRNLHGDDEDVIGEYPELGDIVTQSVAIEDPRNDIMEWIKTLYLQSRGMDLGTFSSDLLSVAFGEQSRQWEDLVKVYMGEVVRLIHHFMNEALHHVCKDDDIIQGLWSAITDPVLEKYMAGQAQAALLVDIERHQRSFTLNSVFNDEVQTARGMRTREMLKSKAWKGARRLDEAPMLINLDDVPLTTAAKSNEQYLEEEIHDKLRSYYHLAVDRITDNVFRQAVCHHLLTGPSSPLNVFSQEWVIDLDDAQLELIAGEKEATKKRREILTKKMKDLKTALSILKK